MRRPNLRNISIEWFECSQLKGLYIFNKIIEENFLNKEIPINIKETYRTPNRLYQKRNSSCHIIVKTPNAKKKKKKNIKSSKGKTYNI